jgi:hypothetical protein
MAQNNYLGTDRSSRRHWHSFLSSGCSFVNAFPRRFAPPWSVEELEACFIVKDDAGQKLAFIYYEEEPQRSCSRKTRRGGFQQISLSCGS